MAVDPINREATFRQLADVVEAMTPLGNYEAERFIYELLGDSLPYGFEAQYDGVRVPVYTRSRDAAAKVAPEDWHVAVSGVNDSWHVEMTHTPKGSLGSVTAFAQTEALARTAAGLRAHAVVERAA